MRRTRVVLAELAGMLRDIVRDAVAGEPDMELVGDVATCPRACAVINEHQADVLVIGRELSPAAGPDLELLSDYRDTTVLVLTPDGRRAFRYDLSRAPIPLHTDGEGVSPQHLLAAIRGAGAHARGGVPS